MSFANYAWKLKENVDDELVTFLSSESGVSENLVRLCVERGIQTAEDLARISFANTTISSTTHFYYMIWIKR